MKTQRQPRPTVKAILDEQVTLSVECLDRLYLNGYVPGLQTGAGLVRFLVQHLKFPVASPALLGQITQGYVRRVEAYIQKHRLPVVHFQKRERKDRIARQPVFVKHYYFYLQDAQFGEAFIKVCTYAPFAIKLYLNGHEWAKRPLEKEGIAFEALDNGFWRCANPTRLQTLCDQLGPEQIQAFLNRWLHRLPFPLEQADRQAGYTPRLSIWLQEF